MESLSSVVICSVGHRAGKDEEKTRNPSRALATILRRDNGGSPRTKAVEVVRGGQILDVF